MMKCDFCSLALPVKCFYKCYHCERMLCLNCQLTHGRAIMFNSVQIPNAVGAKVIGRN